MWACFYNKIETVKYLLKLPGIDINGAKYENLTALGQAIKKGYKDIADLLRAHGGI